jgi:rod shape determining protein RodA
MIEQGAFRQRIEVLGRKRIIPERLSEKAPIRHLDFSLLLATLALGAVGGIAVWSATRPSLVALGADENQYLKRQLAFLAVATVAFVITLLFDYRQLRGLSYLILAGGVVLLLIVFTPLGHSTAGAQRWINLGPFQMQPSEFMKIALIASLAALYADERRDQRAARLPIALGLTAVPGFLIFLQPDLGTLMVFGASLLTVVLIAGTRARWIVLLLLTAVIVFILVLNVGLLKDYQVRRLTGWLDPESDPQRAGYNAAQSKIAVASGGLVGKGLFKGTQTNLDYVPEQHTDFIFTVIGEEAGFFGGAVVLSLFALIVWRAIRIAMLSKDNFGAILAAGIGGMFAFQVFVNIGMTVGIMPITGIPLPFVSYGGSSLVASFTAVGLLMNVHMRRFV